VGGRTGGHPTGRTADDFWLYNAHAGPFCDCRRLPACANDAAQAARALDDALSTVFCTVTWMPMGGWSRPVSTPPDAGWVGGGALTHHPRSGRPAECVTGLGPCTASVSSAVNLRATDSGRGTSRAATMTRSWPLDGGWMATCSAGQCAPASSRRPVKATSACIGLQRRVEFWSSLRSRRRGSGPVLASAALVANPPPPDARTVSTTCIPNELGVAIRTHGSAGSASREPHCSHSKGMH